MISPQEALNRADLAFSDLGSGGLAPPIVSDKFISRVYETPTILNAATHEVITSSEWKIPNLLFDDQIMVGSPGDNTAIADADRTSAVPGQTTLAPAEIVGEVAVPYTVFESNVEREKLQDTLLMHIGKRVAKDLSLVGLHGDTTIANTTKENRLLRVTDGWFKLASANQLDALGGNLDRAMFTSWYKAMPYKHLQDAANSMEFFVHSSCAIDWQDSVASRATPGGDATLASGTIPRFFNRPVNADPTIKVQTENGYANATRGLFCNPKNLVVALHRDLTIEILRQPRQRNIVFVISLRVAYGFFLSGAVSPVINLVPKS